MFRFNLVCAPEMSVSNEAKVESRPHAWVQFDVDEEKAFVPLNFILKHPPEWRKKAAWDTSYLYKVFWSPQDDDSPSEMSKREVQIPVYEKGAALEKPGYYRASVLAVDETLEAVQKQVGDKRVSVGLLKFKYSSFDGSSSSSKTKTDKSSALDSKRKSKKTKKSQSKGFDHESHIKNLNFDASLESKYSFLTEGSQGCSQVTDSNSASGSLRRSGRQLGGRRKRDASISDSDVEVADPTDESKKIKLDPNYTPVKTVSLEEQLVSAKSNLDKSYNRNKKLESDIQALLHEKRELQGKVCVLTDEIKELQEQFESLQKKYQAANGICCKCKVGSDIEMNSDDDKKNFDQSDERYAGAMKYCETILSGKSDTKEKEDVKMDLSNDEVIIPPTDMAGKEQDGAVSMAVSDHDGSGTSKPKMEGGNRGYQLCPGVIIAPDVWSAIEALSKSEKKDKFYIKDLSFAAFGPEVLASSTICGTKKGGRKKKKEEAETEEQEPKPGLDKLILKAVREKFIARVEENEGRKIDLPDDEPRTKLKKFNDAIRDGQKRLVGLGYGKGKLSNEVKKSLLMNV